MFRDKELLSMLSWILLLGMFVSLMLVIVGGTMYLWQYGNDSMQNMLSAHYNITIKQILFRAFTLTPLAMIEVGLFILVMTQVLRVVALACFYTVNRDYKFILISFFVLATLIYSIFIHSTVA